MQVPDLLLSFPKTPRQFAPELLGEYFSIDLFDAEFPKHPVTPGDDGRFHRKHEGNLFVRRDGAVGLPATHELVHTPLQTGQVPVWFVEKSV